MWGCSAPGGLGCALARRRTCRGTCRGGPASPRRDWPQNSVLARQRATGFFESGVDSVVIAMVISSHPELVELAVRSKTPVLCEKPLAREVGADRELVERIERFDIRVQVGLQRRFGVCSRRGNGFESEGWVGCTCCTR